MKFLIIDDSEYKINELKNFLTEHEIDIANSYNSGMRKLISNKYDGLFLDMAFPQFDDTPWKICSTNGLCVLSEMRRKKINIPVTIFSSGTTDVSGYEAVKEYILHGNVYIGDKVRDFIALCAHEKEKNEGGN